MGGCGGIHLVDHLGVCIHLGEAVPAVADRVVGAAGEALRDLVPLVAELLHGRRAVEVEVEVVVLVEVLEVLEVWRWRR